jgi:type II secretory pathway pseudopilin PulG
MYKNTFSHSKGFTLIETLVAILILMMSVAAIMGLIGNILNATRDARLLVTADYLLQEGVEYVRNNRDSALNNGATWLDFASPVCPVSYPYITVINPVNIPSLCDCHNAVSKSCDVNPIFNEVVPCPPGGQCPNIVRAIASSQTFYCTPGTPSCPGSYTVNSTNFNRNITIENNPGNPDEIFVTVKVSWVSTGGTPKSKTITQSFFNW